MGEQRRAFPQKSQARLRSWLTPPSFLSHQGEMNPLLRLRPRPAHLNSGLTSLRPESCLRWLGPPTDPALRARWVTQSVGPFRVTGHPLAVDSLRHLLAEVHALHPAVTALLGSAGMGNVRRQRGNPRRWSIHAWGLAIDLTLAGRVDPRGDRLVPEALLRIAPVFHRHGWFWGAAFPTEDAMHFEVAEETARRWFASGRSRG